MLNKTAWTTLCATALMVAAPSAQQDLSTFRSDRWIELGTLADAKVRLLPSPAQVRDAAEDGKKVAHSKGSIVDLLLDSSKGEMRWAIVSCGGLLGIGDKTVAVPMQHLTWNVQEDCYDLQSTRAELDRLPVFDLAEARAAGLEGTLAAAAAAWNVVTADDAKAKEASSPAKDKVLVYEDVEFAVVPTSFLSSKELNHLDVWARHEVFGDVKTCIVDRDQNRVAYVVLSHGGIAGLGADKFIVPYGALTLCRRAEVVDPKPSNLLLSIDRSIEAMKSGVQYEQPKKGVLTAETIRRVNEVFREPRG